jgi:hypothetical protein
MKAVGRKLFCRHDRRELETEHALAPRRQIRSHLLQFACTPREHSIERPR